MHPILVPPPTVMVIEIDSMGRINCSRRALFQGMPLACVGKVTEERAFVVKGTDGREIAHIDVAALASAWQKPFGDLILKKSCQILNEVEAGVGLFCPYRAGSRGEALSFRRWTRV